MNREAKPNIIALDFERDIQHLATDFIGREWIFQKIEEWIENYCEGFFILTGEAGIGKSAVAARLIQYRQDIAAYNFCIAGRNSTITPCSVLRSFAAQLGENLPGYGLALSNTINPSRLSVKVNIDVKTMTGGKITGVIIDKLNFANTKQEIESLLTAPLSIMKAPSRPILILLDSLDEAFTYSTSENLVTLLTGLNDLPHWVRIICTTRPDARVLSCFGSMKNHIISAKSQENREDLRRYVNYRLDKPNMLARIQALPSPIEPEILANQIVGIGDGPSLADGNFLYTKILLDDIENGIQSLDDIGALPISLDDIYQRFLLRLAPEWEAKYLPLLAVLAVSCEPLSREQLMNFSNQSARLIGGQMNSTLLNLSISVLIQFLNVQTDGKEEKFSLFHQSLRDYLVEINRSGRFACPSQDGNMAIGNYYLQAYGTDWTRCDQYGVSYLQGHFHGSSRPIEAVNLITNLSFLKNCAQRYGEQRGYWSAARIYDYFRSSLNEIPNHLVQENERLCNIVEMPVYPFGRKANDLETGGLSNYQERNLFSFSCCLYFSYFLKIGSFSTTAICERCGEQNIEYGVDIDESSAFIDEYFFAWCQDCLWSSSQYSHSDEINYIPSRFDHEKCGWMEERC